MEKIDALWAKIKAWFSHSLTMAVGWVITAASGVVVTIFELADMLDHPEVKDSVINFLSLGNPKAVAIGGTVLGVIVILARLRSLRK